MSRDDMLIDMGVSLVRPSRGLCAVLAAALLAVGATSCRPESPTDPVAREDPPGTSPADREVVAPAPTGREPQRVPGPRPQDPVAASVRLAVVVSGGRSAPREIRLEPVEPRARTGQLTAVAGADGSFVVEQMPTGVAFRLSAADGVGAFCPAEVLTFGHATAPQEMLVVYTDESRTAPATVRVVDELGAAIGGACVSIRTRRPDGGTDDVISSFAVTAPDGSVQFRRDVASRYTVAAVRAQGYDLLPPYLASRRDRAVVLPADAPVGEAPTLVLPRTGSLVIRIRGIGLPAGFNPSVGLYRELPNGVRDGVGPAPWCDRTLSTEAGGITECAYADMPTGRYAVLVRVPGRPGALTLAEVLVRANTTVDVSIGDAPGSVKFELQGRLPDDRTEFGFAFTAHRPGFAGDTRWVALSNAKPTFLVAGLEPGRWTANLFDWSSALDVNVGAGETNVAIPSVSPMTTAEPPTGRLLLKLIGADGERIWHVFAAIRPSSEPAAAIGSFYRAVGATGSIRGLAPGRYRVELIDGLGGGVLSLPGARREFDVDWTGRDYQFEHRVY